MARGIDEIQEILEEIEKKIFLANITGELDDLLTKWGLANFVQTAPLYEPYKSGKIVVVGQTELTESILLAIGKQFGLDKGRFEFCLDYTKAQKFNYKKLQHNTSYSAILFGPVPHSTKYKGDSNNIIAELEKQSGYPHIGRISTGNELKITNTSFKRALESLLKNNIICRDY